MYFKQTCLYLFGHIYFRVHFVHIVIFFTHIFFTFANKMLFLTHFRFGTFVKFTNRKSASEPKNVCTHILHLTI